jgi:acyl carrier protein
MFNSQLGVDTDEVRLDSRLVEDLNMNDLDLAETMLDIELKFSVIISDEDRAAFATVGDLVRFIDAYQAAQQP